MPREGVPVSATVGLSALTGAVLVSAGWPHAWAYPLLRDAPQKWVRFLACRVTGIAETGTQRVSQSKRGRKCSRTTAAGCMHPYPFLRPYPQKRVRRWAANARHHRHSQKRVRFSRRTARLIAPTGARCRACMEHRFRASCAAPARAGSLSATAFSMIRNGMRRVPAGRGSLGCGWACGRLRHPPGTLQSADRGFGADAVPITGGDNLHELACPFLQALGTPDRRPYRGGGRADDVPYHGAGGGVGRRQPGDAGGVGRRAPAIGDPGGDRFFS